MNIAVRKFFAFFKSAGNQSSGKINAYISCPLKYKYQYLGGRKSQMSSHYLSFANSMQDAIEAMHAEDLSEIDETQITEILKSCWNGRGFATSAQEDNFWMMGLRLLVDYADKNNLTSS